MHSEYVSPMIRTCRIMLVFLCAYNAIHMIQEGVAKMHTQIFRFTACMVHTVCLHVHACKIVMISVN